MKIAYVDCFSGAAGDMLLGALLDAGLDFEALRKELDKLPLKDYELTMEEQMRHGLTGSKFDVKLLHHHHAHRHLADIEALIEGSGLSAGVRSRSMAVFRRLARAEAKVHGASIEEIHFHEVGAVDSIVDMVGFVVGLELLGIEELYSSMLTLGGGTVQTEHGLLPAPAPATLEILAKAGAPTCHHPKAQTELLTPTAAALLVELAEFRHPSMNIEAVGYGFGTKELDWPNAVRVWLGETGLPAQEDRDEVALLECNMDDTTGERLGYAMEQCLAAGALDAWFTPIQMKKNRPGVKFSLLAPPDLVPKLSELLLRETSTLGVRFTTCPRRKAGRRIRSVETPWGKVQVKEKVLEGEVVAHSPEYEDCARLARKADVPLAEVYEAVREASRP
ncbi:MAG: nickel pincer cofactor biosynthesis protein LarC [Chloroflexota bacterium]|nr:nickel pincer cofactor biosynthesis protein LarC [Chloroflexota bacterium]